MSLIIVETDAKQPLTMEVLNAIDRRVSPCLKERDVKWCSSLVSGDRYRMICTYDAPDAESVREAHRRGRYQSSRTWTGVLIKPEGAQPQRNTALLKVVERTCPPLSAEDWNKVNHQILNCYAEQGIEWIQSYISLDRTRVITELNAPDIESIQAIQRKVGIFFNRVWPAEFISD